MIRILLVDDHAVVRMGFRLLLQSVADMSVIAEAESGEAACQLYLDSIPTSWSWIWPCRGWRSRALRRIRARPSPGTSADFVGAR